MTYDHVPYYPVGVPSEAGSVTSALAAESMAAAAPSCEERVYAFILSKGYFGATDDEVEQATGLIHQNASARRRTLELKKRVVRTKNTRYTRRGRKAAVYIAEVLT